MTGKFNTGNWIMKNITQIIMVCITIAGLIYGAGQIAKQVSVLSDNVTKLEQKIEKFIDTNNIIMKEHVYMKAEIENIKDRLNKGGL